MRNMEGNQPIRSPSSEGDFCSDEDDVAKTMFPLPHSHWFPRPIAFKSYKSPGGKPKLDLGQRGAGRLHIQVSRPVPVRVTKEIVDTFQLCNPNFEYSESCNPKRFLTNPSVGVSNDGLDNANHDLILYYGRVLANDDNTRRYVVKELVGCGTFGQVARCLTLETNEQVAVKVIKNQRAYSTQAKVEIGILHVLNNICDYRNNKHHVVRSLDHFSFHGHLCIVFELLGVNLFEVLKTNQLKGISIKTIREFTSQLLDALTLLHDAHVIHCDLKPENILLTSYKEIKLIDFGSACMEEQTVYSYIQSRFYRSPEVVLGHPYSTAIDMWSLGCVAAELFLGLPLFPGQCAYDLLLFIIEKLGVQPPDHILQNAKFTKKFFKVTSAAPQSADTQISAYQFLTPEENEARESKKPVIGKRYMAGTLEQMIMSYPMRPMSKEEEGEEVCAREAFVDFLRGLVEVDPFKRWTPRQASQHPFLTQVPFNGFFNPLPEAPRVTIGQGRVMEHPSSSGHWFGAGLSPHVSNMSLAAHYNGGPQYQPPPYAVASNDSPVSFGSFGDTGAPGSSFGSNGDSTSLSMSYPAGLSGHTSLIAGSLDAAWHRMPPLQSTGQTQLGMSPLPGLSMRPLSLGGSPSLPFNTGGTNFPASPGSQHVSSPGSQYLASPGFVYQGSPGSAFQSSPGSSFRCPASPTQGSPNRYGPTSPAHAVREAAIAGQYNKRRNARLAAPALASAGGTAHDIAHWARLQQSNASGNMDTGSGTYGLNQAGPRMSPQWRSLRTGGNSGLMDHPELSNAFAQGTLGSHFLTSETSTEAGDEEPAGPGDWDADFREEHLLENDPLPQGTGFLMPSQMGPSDGVMGSGGARLGPGPGSGSVPGQGPVFSMGHMYPPIGHPSRRVHGQKGLLMSVEGSPPSLQSSLQGLHSGHGRSQLSKYGQTSPSRLGQQHWQQQHKHSQALQHAQYIQPQQSPDFQTIGSYSGNNSGNTSGPNSGPNSGPPSRRFPSGDSSGMSSPAGVLQFQQRQQYPYHSPHQSPDSTGHGHNMGDVGKIPGSSGGILPSPQRDTRGGYAADGNSRQVMGMVHEGYSGTGSFTDRGGFPMAAGLGQTQIYGVVDNSPSWAAPHTIFPQGQLYATELFTGRRPGQGWVGVRPPTGRGAYRFAK